MGGESEGGTLEGMVIPPGITSSWGSFLAEVYELELRGGLLAPL